MQNTLFQAICRMGIFMICAQAMIHFRPKEVYDKYLKLLVSIMVLIQVFLPIGSFLLGKGSQEAAQALEQFRQDLEQSMAQAEENAAAADALLEKMTLEEVRSRLEAQKESGAEGNIGRVSPEEGSDEPEESGRGEGGSGAGLEGSDGEEEGSGAGMEGSGRKEGKTGTGLEGSDGEEGETGGNVAEPDREGAGVGTVEPIVIEVTIP